MEYEESIKFLIAHQENFEEGNFVHSQLTTIIKQLKLTKNYKDLWEESQLALEDVGVRIKDAIKCNKNMLLRMNIK